ncbi:MAG: hypothetical protein SNG14_05580 [Rikenellaceae bacterium]
MRSLKILAATIFALTATTTTAVAELNTKYFRALQTEQLTSTQQVTWKNFGPAMSGYCDAFWIHPTDPNFMYVTLDMGNGYYTADGANSWMTYQKWDESGSDYRLDGVDFSRQDPTFGLAMNLRGRLMVTKDQGRTFNLMTTTGFDSSRGQTDKSIITVDPTNDNNWYVGAGKGWRSKSNHYSIKNPHGTTKSNNKRGCILVSKNRGKSWTEVGNGFEDWDIFRIFVNPRNPKELYAFTNYGFYRSVNAGKSFEKTGKGLPFNISRDGAMHYNEKSGKVTLFLLEQTNYFEDGETVSSKGGVFRSDDSGETWSCITGDMELDYTKLEPDNLVKKSFHKTMSGWFNITDTESRKRFTKLPTRLLSVYNRLIVNPNNVNEICVMSNAAHDRGVGPVEMWKTDNGGGHWYPTMRNGEYWESGKGREYWLSRGDGKDEIGRNMTFAHLEKEMKESNYSYAGARWAQFNTRNEIIAVMQQQVFRSTDHGKSFKQIDDIEATKGSWVGKGCSNLPGQAVVVDTHMKSPLFRAGEHGLWRLGDMGDCKYDGVAVKQLTGQSKSGHDARSISTVAVNPRDTNKIYTLQFRQHRCGYLWGSKDGGETWAEVNKDKRAVPYSTKSKETIFQRDLHIDGDDPNRMYFALPRDWDCYYTPSQWASNLPPKFPANSHGVYRSTDEGVNWGLANSGLPENANVWSIEMSPKDSKVLYACLTGDYDDRKKPKKMVGGSLYRSMDGAESWTKVKIPAEIEIVRQLFVDKTTGALYLSAGQAAGEAQSGGVWRSNDEGKTWRKIFEMAHVKGCTSSMANPQIIAVNVGSTKGKDNVNAGAYISLDGGANWIKANYQLGQPSRINTLELDPRDESVVWCSLYGSGWYKGTIHKK